MTNMSFRGSKSREINMALPTKERYFRGRIPIGCACKQIWLSSWNTTLEQWNQNFWQEFWIRPKSMDIWTINLTWCWLWFRSWNTTLEQFSTNRNIWIGLKSIDIWTIKFEYCWKLLNRQKFSRIGFQEAWCYRRTDLAADEFVWFVNVMVRFGPFRRFSSYLIAKRKHE